MERGNSSHQIPSNSTNSSNSTNPNYAYPPNFSSSQNSSQMFGYTQNFSFHPQFSTPHIPQNLQHPQFSIPGAQFAHIIQPPQFSQPSQMPINIQNSQFPGTMQFSQFPPFSTQGDNEVTVVPPPAHSASSRRTPWSIEDDKMLARAHATIGQDNQRGNEQTGATFWKRVEKYYNDNHPNGGPRRTHDKLKAHWGLIRARTHDFHSIYCKLQSMRPSGASDADIICRATEEYKQKHGREKFGYEHVWSICKDLPSWAPSFMARQKSVSQSSTDTPTSHSAQGSGEGSEEVFPRPPGKKAAKRKAKERYAGDDAIDELQQAVNRQVHLLENINQRKMKTMRQSSHI